MKLQFAVLFLLVSAAAAAASIRLAGAWTPIKNLNDPEVVEIANFAVDQYKRQNNPIKLKSIEKGETQIVAGTNYRLLLVVELEDSATKKYDAVVWEKLDNSKELLSFTPHK